MEWILIIVLCLIILRLLQSDNSKQGNTKMSNRGSSLSNYEKFDMFNKFNKK